MLKPQPGGHLPVRVTAACNRLLALPGTTVREVWFEPARITVTVALRRRRLACADCSPLQQGPLRHPHGRLQLAAPGPWPPAAGREGQTAPDRLPPPWGAHRGRAVR